MAEKAYVSDRKRSPGIERRSTAMTGARRDHESRRAVSATAGAAGAARWVLEPQQQDGDQAVGGLSAGDRGFQRRSIIPTRVEAEPESPASSGRSLDPATQATMGSLLGSDFSKVKIHSGEAAADSARRLEARAYTVGDHIVLGQAVSNLNTRSGRFLLAHELAHVVQQRLGGPAPGGGLDEASEREAETTAGAVADGRRPPSLVRGAAVGLQRQAAHPPGAVSDVDRAHQIDDYVRAHPGLSTVALQQLLNERNALLPLAQEPPAPAMGQPSAPPGGAPGGSPSSPLELPDAIPLAAGMILVPTTSLAPAVPPAVLFGTGAAGTGAAVGTTTALGTGVAVGTGAAAETAAIGTGVAVGTAAAAETAAVGTSAALATAGGVSWVPIVGWIIAGLIVVGVVGFLVYRHYNTAPSRGLPERVEAPPQQPGSPISAPGQPGAPVSLPAHDTGRGPVSLPGGSVPQPVLLPGQPAEGPLHVAGQSSEESERYVSRMRDLKERNPGLIDRWEDLEQRLSASDVRVRQTAIDELGHLEVQDYLKPTPAPATPTGSIPAPGGSDIEAQENLHRDLAQHAWEDPEHRADLARVGATTPGQAAQLIGEIIATTVTSDTYVRTLPGRHATAYVDRRRNLVVIVPGPDSSEPGTVFTPDRDPDAYLTKDGFRRLRR